MSQVYFVDKNENDEPVLIPLRIPDRRIDISDTVVGYMSKIKEVGNSSTVSYESSWCESDSGVVPQSCGGAAILVEKVNIHPQRYQGAQNKALTPVPSRNKTKN